MAQPPLSIGNRLSRFLIKSGKLGGPIGMPGRFWGRAVGVKLPGGATIRITNPRETIQAIVVHRGVYEPNIAALISALMKPGKVFIDIGANIGVHSLVAAGHGATVKSFEPVPRIGDALLRSVKASHLDQRVELVRSALGAKEGQITIYVARRSDDGSHSAVAGIPAESIDSISVPMTTLDTFLQQRSIKPDLLKIDVEGFESQVLDGATSLLSSQDAPPIIMETGDRLADQLGESAASSIRRLTEKNYAIFRIPDEGKIHPVKLSELSGELNNYFCLPNRMLSDGEVMRRLKPLMD